MLTISPRSTRSAQRSFWKLIDEAPEAVLSHPLHCHLRGLCGEYVTAIPVRSTSSQFGEELTPSSSLGGRTKRRS